MTNRPYNHFTPNPLRPFLLEVAKGNVAGHSLVHKFGRNAALPNGSWAFVVGLGLTAWPLSAATAVRVKAGDVADDAGGAGAREITVQGIDDALAETSEAITTNGVAASTATTALFWRVHRAWVSSAGTYGAANTAAVVIENGAGGTDLIQIAVEEGQTQFAGWSVPLGKTAYLISASFTVDATKSADFRLFTRESLNDATPPVASVRIRRYWDGVAGDLMYTPTSPELSCPALTDIWIEGYGNGAGVEAAASFELLLVDD